MKSTMPKLNHAAASCPPLPKVVFEIKIAAQIEDFKPPIGGFPKGVFDFAPAAASCYLNFDKISST